MGSVEESGVRPMENTLARIQRNSAISVQTDLLFRCRAGNRLDDGHPGYVEAVLSFIPEGGPIEFYLPALRYVCISENTTRRHVNPGISRWTGGVALNNAFCFKRTPWVRARPIQNQIPPLCPTFDPDSIVPFGYRGVQDSLFLGNWNGYFLVAWRRQTLILIYVDFYLKFVK